MHPGARLRLTLPLLAGLCAGPGAARPGPTLTTTLSVRAGYDDDLYAAEHGRLAERGSAFSSAGIRLAAAFGPGLSLAYAPSAAVYFEEPDEDHVKHLLSAAWQDKVGALSWNAATDFALVDGDDRGVDYGPGCGNAFSTAYPRERRDQWHNKTDLALRHDSSAGFVRAVGKLLSWDMRTAPVSGVNYIDRYDVQGGLDLGRPLRGDGPEAYLGYRRGYQFQDRDARPDLPRHASNHYDRALLGLDGKLGSAVAVSAQIGWARHAYPDDPAVYAGSANEEGLFTDITLTWTATKADEIQFKTSQARTSSTTGTNGFLVTTHQLAWKHRFNRAWSATLTGRVAEAEYSPAPRDDLAYALSGNLAWQINDSLGCTFALGHEFARDHHNRISGSASGLRDFDRTVVSVGLNWKL